MKKFFGLLILLLLFVFGYIYINKNVVIEEKNDFLSDVLDDYATINDYYIYGNHFNIFGSIDVNDEDVNKYSLVLKSNDDEYELDCVFEMDNDIIIFYTSNLINKGINLDKLNRGNYYLLIKYLDNDIIKYYSLKNKTSFDDMEYYTVTSNNENNRINIVFDNKMVSNREIDYVQFKIERKKLPSDVYDFVIDPGHGGVDTGADYKYNNKIYYESNITLNIVLKLKMNLEKKGFKVLLTREKDTDLDFYNENGRAVIPNKFHAKLCFSIHLNSEKNMKYGGVEVYVPNDIDYTLSKLLAKNLSSVNGYSKKIFNKISDGVYFNGFTSEGVIEANNEYVSKGLKKYDIVVGAPEMYMIREVGGRVTHAYVDGRNEKYGINPFYNSNQTAEGYLIELGYISYEDDLIKFIENEDSFSKAISNSIGEYFN